LSPTRTVAAVSSSFWVNSSITTFSPAILQPQRIRSYTRALFVIILSSEVFDVFCIIILFDLFVVFDVHYIILFLPIGLWSRTTNTSTYVRVFESAEHYNKLFVYFRPQQLFLYLHYRSRLGTSYCHYSV